MFGLGNGGKKFGKNIAFKKRIIIAGRFGQLGTGECQKLRIIKFHFFKEIIHDQCFTLVSG